MLIEKWRSRESGEIGGIVTFFAGREILHFSLDFGIKYPYISHVIMIIPKFGMIVYQSKKERIMQYLIPKSADGEDGYDSYDVQPGVITDCAKSTFVGSVFYSSMKDVEKPSWTEKEEQDVLRYIILALMSRTTPDRGTENLCLSTIGTPKGCRRVIAASGKGWSVLIDIGVEPNCFTIEPETSATVINLTVFGKEVQN